MIKKLPPHIVHQIAAGEVIERPASALKEILENALDAQASRIRISVEEGGLKLLAVEDDGKGMNLDELPLAFEAHATSKLHQIEDLDSLNTFGFRGEALSSIASVADLQIWSSAEGAETGCLGRIAFGEVQEMRLADRRMGTEVRVTDLFSRHAARLKFMKTPGAETRAIQAMWQKYALAYPEVAFNFVAGASPEVRLPKQSLFDRSLWFFGSESPDSWIHQRAEKTAWRVETLFLKPRKFGEVRSGVHLYLNRRPIRDSKLEFAVRRAFEGFSDQLREIAGVVFIEGIGEEFDVNVHPMKLEVRFRNPDPLFSLIVHTIRDPLMTEHRLPAISPVIRSVSEPIFERTEAASEPLRPDVPRVNLEPTVTQNVPILPMPITPSFHYVGSFDSTYLIASKDDVLYLFDQHALHERILYEDLLSTYREGKRVASQRLLFPLPLRSNAMTSLLDQEELLENLGFELRSWKENEIQMLAAPAILKHSHREVLEKLCQSLELPKETLLREILSTMACHSAVRAHDNLSRFEAEKLLSRFSAEDALGHCPHGRPTFIKFQTRDLEKLFHRIL